MISSRNLLSLNEEIKESEHLLSLFKDRVKNASEIITDGTDPEKERARILKLVSSHKQNLSEIKGLVQDKTDPEAVNSNHPKYFARLQKVNLILGGIRSITETIADEQYECKLNAINQNLFKALDAISELFQFITPNMRNEIDLLTKHYRIPSKTQESIIPELEALMTQLEENKISLTEFTEGYEKEGTRIRGYDDLRIHGGMFSKYQFYENCPTEYGEINFCYQRYLKAAVDFLSKRVMESDFRKLLDRMNKLPQRITKMGELFEIDTCINLVYQKISKKYSFHERFKELTPLLEEINKLKVTLIYYHDEAFEQTVKDLEKTFEEEADLKRFEDIIDEVRKQIEFKTMPFDRLPMIFSSLMEKNFNIVLQQKEAEDITIEITPHHEQKFGRKNLERVNIIIQEIDFWYPVENKQLLFQDLSLMTRKFQGDEPIDEKRFYALIKSYDQEIEKNTRIYYPKKIQYLKTVYTLFHNLIVQRANRSKLSSRLQNPTIWPEISPRLKVVSKAILVLNSDSPSLAGNVNKFVFIKIATEELCQLLYDLAMQLFAVYRGVDLRSVGNMTSILSIYNEFYDIYSLWSVFNHYFNKNHFNNFSINEDIVVQITKNDHCKERLRSLLSESEDEPQKTSG
ncbi:MAG: hypothetical protein HN907_05325 [Nitrospina sp.]|nr:hypothetical protein [Nitrospina sp.]